MNRNCRECGRYLPSLASQRRGIGPKCARRERQKFESWYKPQQVAEARDIRRHRQIKQVRPGVYKVKSYLTARNTCTCPSGRYRPVFGSCKHTLAVQLEEVVGGTR